MGLGNRNSKEGDKGSGYSYELKSLQGLQQSLTLLAGLATEPTLQMVLSAIQDGQDFEAKLIEDANGATFLEVRIWNPDTQTWEAPQYYAPGNNTPYSVGDPGGPVAPIVYINNGAILAQIYTELLDQGLTLDAINLNTDNLEGLLTAIDGVLDLSLVELQAINVNTDQLEALSTDIKNLLTTIDVDTGNIATSVAALETCCAATNVLLTTIDAVLDQIQTNTLNTVNALTTANVTLGSIENELIALNNTASTLATEATLELVRLQLVALNTTDFATETTLASANNFLNLLLAAFNAEDFATETTLAALNAKLNSLGQKASAASAPVVLSTEQELILDAIKTAVENIDNDLGTGGLATEVTLQAVETLITSTNALLTTIDADTSNLDVLLSTRASEITLQATNTILTTIDGVLDAIKVDTGALVVDVAAIEVLITTTNSLLTTIDGVLDAIKLDTANLDVALSTRASEATLQAAATDINDIEVLLTPASRTHNTLVGTLPGFVPAGSMSGSVLNAGNAAGTWNGVSIPAGVTIPWGPIGNRDTYGAITYDATGTTFIIEYTT